MFEEMTPEKIKEEMLNALGTDINIQEGSYTDTLLSPVSLAIWKVYEGMKALLPIVYIDETSGPYIDKRCSEVGITRKPGTKAKVVLHFTGAENALVPIGTVFLTPTGLEFVTKHSATVTEGTATASAEAEEVGANYNVTADSIVNQYNSISGINSVTNPLPAEGGADPESDADLVKRYYNYKRKPPTSGNVYHYEQWAMEVPGVGAVKVTPLADGPGTVKVLIVGPDKQPVDNEIVSACSEHMEKNRPVGAAVTVKSPEALPIHVSAQVTVRLGATKELVRQKFTAAIDEYLKNISFTRYELLYNQIAYQLLGIEGVEDYTELTVNGAADNIVIGAEQVPILGTVEVL